MKTIIKFLFYIILIQIPVMAESQSFVSYKNLWSILGEDSFEGKWARTSYYKFSGDTIVGQITYLKLYMTEDEQKENWKLASLWREHNDSVFKYSEYDMSDILIYNFNLQEKDSFLVAEVLKYIYVDSIRMKQWGGEERKHIYLSSPDQPYLLTTWISGVGQNGEITRSSEIGITGAFVKILCFSQNGELLYQDPEYNTCYLNTTSALVYTKNEEFASIYVTGEATVHIDLLQDETGTLHLYTPNGKQILKCPLTAPETILCAPGAGLFLYRFVSEKGGVQSGKVVVK